MRSAPCTLFFRVGSLRFVFAKLLICAAIFMKTPAAVAADRHGGSDRVSIAAAANLVYALDALTASFRQSEPAVTITVATGASGTLVAQIRDGAPYDVFLSADVDYPRALIASGNAKPASLTVFALGRLVLWTTRADVPLDSFAAAVRSPRVRKLALANLDTAPYGRAARQTLEALDLWTEAKRKLVMGENITQTAQFVETGNADAGFVALSLVLSPRLRDHGHWLLVPESLHTPIAQGAVLTARGSHNPAAARYLAFLRSEAARKILERFGYGLPP